MHLQVGYPCPLHIYLPLQQFYLTLLDLVVFGKYEAFGVKFALDAFVVRGEFVELCLYLVAHLPEDVPLVAHLLQRTVVNRDAAVQVRRLHPHLLQVLRQLGHLVQLLRESLLPTRLLSRLSLHTLSQMVHLPLELLAQYLILMLQLVDPSIQQQPLIGLLLHLALQI